MATLTADQVAKLALDAGLPSDRAVIAVAVAKAESGFRTDAVGDRSLTDAKWGPSVGLWQIRSLNAERGTGKARDETQLKDPAFNARSMAQISQDGTSFKLWSTYIHGTYTAHLREASTAVANVTGGAPVTVPNTEPSPEQASAPSGLSSILDPRTWVRLAWILGGGILIIVGVVMVARQYAPEGGAALGKLSEVFS